MESDLTDLDGISYLSTLLGKEDQQKKHAYLYWASSEGETSVGVRRERWKLVKYRAKKNSPAGQPDDWRLYDLNTDIGEEKDLSSLHPETVKEILDLLKEDGLL